MLVLIFECTFCGYKFRLPTPPKPAIVTCPKCAFVVYSEPQTANLTLSWELPQTQPNSGKSVGRAPVHQDQQIEWTKSALPSHWAGIFECDVRTLKSMIEKGKIIGEIITSKRWRIAIDSLPAKEKAKHQASK